MKTNQAVRCPRCQLGIDDNNNGDCLICSDLSDADVQRLFYPTKSTKNKGAVQDGEIRPSTK